VEPEGAPCHLHGLARLRLLQATADAEQLMVQLLHGSAAPTLPSTCQQNCLITKSTDHKTTDTGQHMFAVPLLHGSVASALPSTCQSTP
jgi:hypothetical protein